MDVGNWVRDLALVFQSGRVRAARARRFNTAAKSHGAAIVDVLEDRLLLTADFGDAPDTTAATGVNNYQTLAANGGPSHVVDTTQNTLYLGGGVDGEAGTQQSLAANLDNLFTTGGRNDEDGVMSSLDLTATVGASPKITLSATNTTGAAATLYGWIDYNHNGVFENATERAQIAVPTGTTAGRFTLQFPKIVGDVAGGTYARFRLSSDAAAANSTGAAAGGEVEDHRFQIMNQVKMPVAATASPRISAGVHGGPEFVDGDGTGYVSNKPIGDLDGNGVDEIVMGTFGDNFLEDHGALYVLFRNADGSVSSSVRISDQVNGGPALDLTESFDGAITPLGDIDGDGIVDIAAGFSDQYDNGSVYIMLLNAAGTVKDYHKISSADVGISPFSVGDSFSAVESLGDIDGDGITDIAVGASGTDYFDDAFEIQTDRGAVYIVRLNADGTVKASTKIDGNGAWNPLSADFDGFGTDITALGDLDSNGMIDLAVMSNIVASEFPFLTAANILLLNSDGTVKQATRLVPNTGGDPAIANIDVMSSITAIGDIDGDGINDLAVSGRETGELSPTTGEPLTNGNVINLLSLNADGTVKHSTVVAGPNSGETTDFNNLTSVSYLGDANGDGHRDLAVGIPFYFDGQTLNSSLSIFSLPSNIENTVAPTVPVLNIFTSGSGQPPAISWPVDLHANSYEIWLRNQTTGQVVLNSVSTTSNSFTPPAGVGNYVVWVRAVNEIGKSSWSRSSTFVSNSPVTVIATPDGMSRRPELKWNSLLGASKYEIWMSNIQTPSVATIQTTTRTNSTSFTPPTNLQAGTYRLWVRGMTADGVKGQWSTVDEFSVVPSTTITRISEPLINRPRFDFTAIPGVAKYDIWISARRSPSTAALHTTTLNASPFYQTTSVLAPGDYLVWVRGVNSDGSFGEWSARSSFTTGAPPQFEALPASELPLDSSVTLKWTPVVGAYRYEVSVERNGEYTLFKTPTTAQITVYGRIQFPQSVTRFQVRAIGSGGAAGSWSSAIEITFQDKVTSVKGVFSAEDTGHPKFTWQRPSGSYTYEVRILDVLNASAEVVHVSDIAASEFIPAESLPIGKYEFQVRPVTAAGAVGVWSNPVVYVSNRIPQLKPVVVGVDPKATLEWEPLDGATSYDLQLFRVIPFNPANGGGGYTLRVETKQSIMTTSLVSPVLVDGLYEWRVREHNSQIWSLTGTFEVARTPIVNHPFFYSTQVEKLLTWSPVTGVDHYEVWINTYRGSLVLPRQNVSTNSFDLASLLPSGKYSFWVRGLGSSGHIGPWSVEESFDIF